MVSPSFSVEPSAKLSWMVWPLLTIVSAVLPHKSFSAGSRDLMGATISTGDCCAPSEQALLAASRSPHLAGPAVPS